MTSVSCLYPDDSGTRNPNHRANRHGARDWFALGGILLHEEDEDAVRRSHEEFCRNWGIAYPLHSIDIRCRSASFSWLATIPRHDYARFMADLTRFLTGIPVIGHACVIDRPGYDKRYRERYGRQQWMLCKTAFSVLCERAAKIARNENRRLRIYPEAGDKSADNALRRYYQDLKQAGMPFAGPDSSKYKALTANELKETLYDLKFKNKTSPMAQIADLYLYPIARGGYDRNYRPYGVLVDRKRVIDAIISEADRQHIGVKYSCFDSIGNRAG